MLSLYPLDGICTVLFLLMRLCRVARFVFLGSTQLKRDRGFPASQSVITMCPCSCIQKVNNGYLHRFIFQFKQEFDKNAFKLGCVEGKPAFTRNESKTWILASRKKTRMLVNRRLSLVLEGVGASTDGQMGTQALQSRHKRH